MREVSIRAARGILEVLDAAGIAHARLLEHIAFPVGLLREPGARIDWNVFVALVDGLEDLCGDQLTVEDIGARIHQAPSFQFLRIASRWVVSPRQLYNLANRWVAPAMFTNVTVTHTWLAEGRLVMTGELAAGYRTSAAFFRLCHANVVALPRLLELPTSTIEEQLLTSSRGRVILVVPASHTIGAKIRRGARAVLSLGEAFRGFARQQAELDGSVEALRTSRHELRQLIERLPDGVLIHRGGIVIWANASALESLGHDRIDDVVGRGLLEFVPPEDRAPLATAVAAAAPKQVTDDWLEYRVLRPDGTIRRLEAKTVQHVDFEGGQARLVVLRDLTEQHRLRDQLALAERMTLLGRLAAGVAHEINNPLAYAQASLEVAVRELASLTGRPASEPMRMGKLEQSLARAREGTERVRGIVRDLRVLSRAEDEPSESVDLPALLDSTLALAANAIAPKATVVRTYRDAPRARATRGQLGQLFLNLLLNAADAIPEGDPARHQIRVAISCDPNGNAIVEVSDTGIGIASTDVARVFDPFFTTKPVGSGTGLGLAICHRIVTQLGGTITFSSRQSPSATESASHPHPALRGGSRDPFGENPEGFSSRQSPSATESASRPHPALRAGSRDPFGENPEGFSSRQSPSAGTTFCVMLPPGDAAPIALEPANGSRRARVLVVDDEPALLRAIGDLIGDTHEVVTASSGRQALDVLRADRGFDVILADLMMADVTGIDLFEVIRSERPELERRFVFMTGGAFTTRGRALLSSVANPCLEKPFDGDDLLRVIGELVE